jgi:hypothetical protein
MGTPMCVEIGPKRSKVEMNIHMSKEAMQPCTKGAPLVDCFPTHLNVPRKQHNRVPIVKTKRINIPN